MPPQDTTHKMVRDVDAKNVERTIRTLVSFGTRNTMSAQDDPKRGIGAARDWLYSEFQKIAATSNGRMNVELQSFDVHPGEFDRITQETKLTNVVATLRGTKWPDRVYVVSGHYDSMCTSPTDIQCDAPGATDDASGVAVVLEAARVMARYPFNATIVFMAVPGEEQHLIGSNYYAKDAKKRGINIDGMFTNDIVGHSEGDPRVRLFSEGVPTNETEQEAATRRNIGGENDSESRELARMIASAASRYVKDFSVWMIYRRDRYLRSGDHVSFLEQGFPAVRFTEPHENYDHQHQNVRVENGKEFGDLPKFVEFPFVANVARVNVAALAELATAPARPAHVRIVTTRLTNDTDLAWDASDGADHYEVVYRETTAAQWQHSISTGTATSYTVKLSKDNYIFGVRAVDAAGHRSPAVYPKPEGRRAPAAK